MSTFAAELLRRDLLRELTILVVAAPPRAGEHPADSVGQAVRAACEELGARVHLYTREASAQQGAAAQGTAVEGAAAEGGPVADDTAMDKVVSAITPLASASAGADAATPAIPTGGPDMLVVDGSSMFAHGGLHACLSGAWDATRAIVNVAFLPAARPGRIVYLAPAPGLGEHAESARAGLENLARTLSVEWARHRITTVTVALGNTTAADEVAALTAYLASPAAAYFSGCQLDLRGV